MATEKKNERKHELKDIQLFEEKGQYYLKLKYIIEDENRISELEIPKVEIPFSSTAFPEVINSTEIHESHYWLRPENLCTLKTGYHPELNVRKSIMPYNNHPSFYSMKTIKEKHKEMTLAEIEKKLGYKIKIVAEE